MESYLDQMVDGIVGFLKDPVKNLLLFLISYRNYPASRKVFFRCRLFLSRNILKNF
jgi:hypothetical protein